MKYINYINYKRFSKISKDGNYIYQKKLIKKVMKSS